MTSAHGNAALPYHLAAFVTVAVWGSTFVSTKTLLMNGLSPAHIFTLRFLIAYVLLLAYTGLTHVWTCRRPATDAHPVTGGDGRRFRLFADSPRDELLFVALGVTGGSLYFLTENEALNYTTTTNTSLIVCSCPLVAAVLISLVYRSERMRLVQAVGSLLAVAGVVVVVLNGHFVLHLSPVGDALALTANLCWAVYSLLMIPANSRYDALFITRKVFFYGLLTIVPYYLVVPTLPSASVLMQPRVLLNLLFLGCVASMLCFLVWTWVMKRLGAMIATNYVYVNPLTTIVFAWWLLDEQITLYFLLGAVLILTGMYLADRRKA